MGRCCHPALTPASAIALMLRAVGGLTTAEIAHAFMVPETTMAQRIGSGQAEHQARRAARTDRHGELIPLGDQDRSRWDAGLIEQGTTLLTQALRRGTVGVYQLQAAIAAAHDRAPRARDTDWREIYGL